MTTLSDLTTIHFAKTRKHWRVDILKDSQKLHWEQAPPTPDGLLMLARLLPAILERFRDDTQPPEGYYDNPT